MQTRRQLLLDRLSQFTHQLTHDPQLIQLLEQHPEANLQRYFASQEFVRLQPLITDHDRLNHAELSEAVLFGLPTSDSEPLPLSPPIEIRLVYYGLRPVALIQGREEELTLWLRYAEQIGMTGLLSAYEWQPAEDLGKGGYANLIDDKRPAQAGSNACRTLLISQDIDNVCLAWFALAYGWDDVLGQLLNYPSCCTQAFIKHWHEAVAHYQGDLVSLILEASKAPPFDWRLNIFARYLGYELIQHFPCSFGCQESRLLAAKTEQVLAQFEPEWINNVRNTLQSPVLFTHNTGIVILHQASVEITNMKYQINFDAKHLQYTAPESPLSLALKAANQLEYFPQDSKVSINTKSFDGFIVTFI